ncbi:hypothetical protein EMCRGX_G001572 [Ephydatia muelleri]
MTLKLGYWDIRDLAQPIRLLLKYTNTEFQNVFYSEGPPPDYNEDEWKAVKFTLGLTLPNLPYLIDGDVNITQSNAIMRYIARKHNLCGRTEEEMIMVDMLENEAMDLRNGFVLDFCYNPNMEAMKPDYLKLAKSRLQKLASVLGNKPWFVGDEITFPDFLLYERLEQHRLFDPSLFNDFPNLLTFLHRFEALPAIKSYMASKEFMRYPVNGYGAQWIGQK